MDVKGHQVVLHQASIFCLVLRHDAVIRRMETRCQVRRLAVSHVERALRADNLDGNFEPKRAVDTAPVVRTVVFVIRLVRDNLVAKKACRGRARMGDQGFLL